MRISYSYSAKPCFHPQLEKSSSQPRTSYSCSIVPTLADLTSAWPGTQLQLRAAGLFCMSVPLGTGTTPWAVG